MADSGFIYAIGIAGRQGVKIGKTTGAVAKRLAMLQTGQPEPLTLLGSVPVECDLSQIEKAIHHFLATERQRGEWFAVTMDQARLETLVECARQPRTSEAPSAGNAMSLQQSVGERVVLLRRRKGLTQPELAHQTGMGITTLNRIENAHSSMTMEKVVALAKALDTSADYLLGLSDNPDSELSPIGMELART